MIIADGIAREVMSQVGFMQRLAAFVPRTRLRLIWFGALATHAKLRALVVPRAVGHTST